MGIFPYIYFMISDFHLTKDDNAISFYAGMVTSAFTFAEFSTGYLWGRLSDRIGRKPVLLTGLMGTGISVLIFGFAPNLYVALAARVIGGLLNGFVRAEDDEEASKTDTSQQHGCSPVHSGRVSH
jgi:MFS family permease